MKWLYQLESAPGEWLPWPDTELEGMVAIPCCEELCTVVAFKQLGQVRVIGGPMVVTVRCVSVPSISERAS
jgi:hypothetical protein